MNFTKWPLLLTSAAVLAACLAGCATEIDFIARGDEMLEKGRFEEALAAYRSALEAGLVPHAARAKLVRTEERAAEFHYLAGRKLCAKGLLEEGIAELDRAVEYNPALKEARTLRHDYASALRRIEKARTLAEAAFKDGDFHAARLQIEDALPLSSNSTEMRELHDLYSQLEASSLYENAREALAEKNLDRTLALARRAAKLDRENEEIARFLAGVEERVKMRDAIVRAKEKLSTLDYYEAFLALGDVIEVDPDHEWALEKIEEVKKKGAQFLKKQAEAFLELNDHPAALRLYARAGVLSGDKAETRRLIAPLRKEAVGRVVSWALKNEREGFPALACLGLLSAESLGYDGKNLSPALERNRTRLDSILRSLVLVEKVRDSSTSGSPVKMVENELVEELDRRWKGGRIDFVGPARAAEMRDAGRVLGPEATVSATIEAFSVINRPAVHVSRTTTYYRKEFSEEQGRTVMIPVPYNYLETYKTKVARGRAFFTIRDNETGRVQGPERVLEEIVEKDLFVQGNEEAGVADNPDTLPTNEEMKESLITRLAMRLAASLSGKFADFDDRYLRLARLAGKEKKEKKRLENYVKYAYLKGLIFSGKAEAPGEYWKAFSSENPQTADELRSEILSATGYDVATGKIDSAFFPAAR